MKALTLQGGLKILEHDAKGAEAAYKKVIELKPEDSHAYIRLGFLYNLTDRKDEAVKNYKKALQLDPHATNALGLIVGNYMKDKNYEGALALCQAHAEKISDNKAGLAFIEYLQGNIFLAQNELVKASQHYSDSIKADPDFLSSYEALARVYTGEETG